VTLKKEYLLKWYRSVGKPIAGYLNFFLNLNFYRRKETNLKYVHRLLIKLHTRVVMNSTIGSTLRPRALDVGSLNYFEAFEMFIDIKTFLKFSVKFKN